MMIVMLTLTWLDDCDTDLDLVVDDKDAGHSGRLPGDTGLALRAH